MAPVSTNEQQSFMETKTMNRLELSKRLRGLLQEHEIVVGGIGNTNFDLFGAGHRPENFYMLGSMGLSVPIGLGLALAQKDRQVFALEGDGSLLMNLGCLSTVAAMSPPNLTIVVWDNGLYQITGGQPAATANVTDLVTIARGAGIANSSWAKDEEDFERLVTDALSSDAPGFIAARIDKEPSTSRPERDPVLLKDRFMKGIGVKSDS